MTLEDLNCLADQYRSLSRVYDQIGKSERTKVLIEPKYDEYGNLSDVLFDGKLPSELLKDIVEKRMREIENIFLKYGIDLPTV